MSRKPLGPSGDLACLGQTFGMLSIKWTIIMYPGIVCASMAWSITTALSQLEYTLTPHR